ncbi:MAG TPA: lantibiotic dehydratase [Trebonia sp.]|nr:lantibiotic dehydratase [Trebonia sp.]
MTLTRRRPRYQAAGFFMVRAPLLPAAGFRRLTGTPAERLSLLDAPLARTAIAAASTELYRALPAPGADAGGDLPERMSRSLFRYLNRMITRPTPFGLFAAVGAGRFTDATSLRLDRTALDRITISPDMAWLEALLRAAGAAAMARGEVPLTVNDSVLESGGRLVHTLAAADGKAGDTVSIRSTGVVAEILELARCPVPAGELVARVAERHRRADPDRIRRLADELLRLDFLRADVLPPAGRPESLPRRPDSRAERLDDIGRELRELAGLGPACLSGTRLLGLAARQRELIPEHTASTFQVDASLALRGSGLSRRVGDAVADAVSALASVTGTANRSLRDYAQAFLERYGPGEEVPVLELLDPHLGLGAPRGYLWPAPEFPPPETARDGSRPREQLLLSWMQEATLDGGPLTLTDERVRLLSGDGPRRPPPPLLDVYVQVHAESPAAIDRGDWLAVLAPMGIVPGGRSFGRFAPLLPEDAAGRLGAFLDSEGRLDPGPVFAELAYRPAEARMRNVSGHTRRRRYEIPVDVGPSVPGDRVLGPRDLLIGIHEDGQFFIRSRRLGRTVVAVQSHMLSPVRAPNVCRFLLEVSADRYHSLWSLREPAFARLPYCPRVVRGKVVIVPARWNLTRALLGETAGDAGFAAAAARWRARFRVPRHVYLLSHDDDQRLLLDLDDDASLAELRRAVGQLSGDPHGSRHYQGLQEVLPGFDGLWLRDAAGEGRFCELVIPLALTRPLEGMPLTETETGTPAETPAAEARASLARAERLDGPGGRWTQVRLYAAADRHDQLIAEAAAHAGELTAGGQAAAWFFIRYADPEPHIRLRLLAAVPERGAEIRERTVAWAHGLAGRGALREFSVDTYRREVGRYGGAAGLAWCERIFHADSVGVSRVLAAAPAPADPAVAAAFTLDRLLSALGLDDGAKLGLSYLRRVSSRPDAGHRQRRARLLELLRLARQAGPGAVPTGGPCALDELYGPAAPLCAEPAAALASLPLTRPWPLIIDSIAHLHANRILGLNRAGEIETAALLRGCLLTLRHAPVPSGSAR